MWPGFGAAAGRGHVPGIPGGCGGGARFNRAEAPGRAGLLCNKLVACEVVNGMDNSIVCVCVCVRTPPPPPPPPSPPPPLLPPSLLSSRSSPTEPRDNAGGHRPGPEDRSSLD